MHLPGLSEKSGKKWKIEICKILEMCSEGYVGGILGCFGVFGVGEMFFPVFFESQIRFSVFWGSQDLVKNRKIEKSKKSKKLKNRKMTFRRRRSNSSH